MTDAAQGAAAGGAASDSPRPFRFGVNLTSTGSRSEWTEKCRRAESLGYDVILMPDHLGLMSPFPALVAAAEATGRPRIGTFVLNVGFWNPVLLAREVAAADQLTGGRLEVGLGAGYVRAEFEAAGLPWEPPAARVARLERTITVLDQLLTDPAHRPQPAQRPRPPLLVGGHGRRLLRLAAERADTVGFVGGVQARGMPEGTLTLVDLQAFTERVEFVRSVAGDRTDTVERNVLVQAVVLTEDRRGTAEQLRESYARSLPDELLLPVDQLLEVPTLLIGTAEQIAEQLRAHRDKLGISYVCVLEPWMEALAPVIKLLR